MPGDIQRQSDFNRKCISRFSTTFNPKFIVTHFRRDGNVVKALENQFRFINNVFMPIVDGINKTSSFFMSRKFLGSLFGSNSSLELAAIAVKTFNNGETIERYIREGLKQSNRHGDDSEFVSFFVFVKHGTYGTKDEKQMDMHVCIFTVRRMKGLKGVKDYVYHDPSPESHKHIIPQYIARLQRPIFKTRTRTFGTPSHLDDCMYQCFKYVIELHSYERQFETFPDK